MANLLKLPPDFVNAPDVFGFFEDFDHLVTADRFTDTSADTNAAVTVSDAVGGIAALSTGDATDNNECYLHTTTELFKFADSKPLVGEAMLKFSQINTNAANVCFGFMDATGANSLLDDGGGPKASYSGALFFVEDGQTVWSIEVSNSTTQTTVRLTAANSLDKVAHTAASTAYQKLRIEFRPYSATAANVLFFIDDVHVYTVSGYTFANATELDLMVGAKAGAASALTVSVDYLAAYQHR